MNLPHSTRLYMQPRPDQTIPVAVRTSTILGETHWHLAVGSDDYDGATLHITFGTADALAAFARSVTVAADRAVAAVGVPA